MSNQNGFVSGSLVTAAFYLIVAIGIAIGFFLSIGIPWLWQYLKPFIHSMTA